MITDIVRERVQRTTDFARRALQADPARRARDFVQHRFIELSSRFGWQNPTASTTSPTEETADVAPRHELPLEELSRADLYALACQLDVKGRKNQRKAQLIEGIRATRGY
jgi:hypothetical protein